jgi:ketosteroid isomerase-like protein
VNTKPTNKTISRNAFIATTAILVILLVGTGAYSLSSMSSNQSAVSNDQSTISSLQAQLSQSEVTQLAYAHFAAIGSENLTATMSQYSSSPTLYWVVAPSSPLNGTYTGTSAVQGTWTKFFKANPTAYYSLYNFTVSVSGNTATVKADVWYVLGGGKATLKLPYVLVYTSSGSSWRLSQEYWGIPGNPGRVSAGIVPTSSSVTA